MVSRKARRSRQTQMVIAMAGALVGTLVGRSAPRTPEAAAPLLIVGLLAAAVVVFTLSWMLVQARGLRPKALKLFRK